MKYKILKDYPGNNWEVGSVLERIKFDINPANFPEFFEEVKETRFKAGDWVVGENNIFGKIKEWGNSSYCYFDDGLQPFKHLLTRLATDKEIEEHLIAKATRKGFAKGVKVIRPEGMECRDIETLSDDKIWYNADSLVINGVTIYQNGAWATIVKEEPIVIAGYKANFEGGTVAFGCRSYSKSEINELLKIMERFEASGINIDISTGAGTFISSNTIRKIRDRIKQI